VIITLRKRIDKELDSPLSDREWNYYKNGDLEKRILRNEIGPEGIAAEISQHREVYQSEFRPPAPTPPANLRKDPARDARASLMSYLISRLAATDEVVKFREEVLGGELLAVDAVEAWVIERSKREGFTLWLEAPYSTDGRLVRKGGKLEIKPAPRWLEFAVPNHPSKSIKTAARGALERLRVLSERVANQLLCERSDVTTFILSGMPLPSYPCQKEFVQRGSGRRLGALNKIKLTIDPTLSPREVANIYRQMRSQIFGKRYRAMSEKHIRLALFAFERDPYEPIKSAMTDWNRTYKKWRYEHESNFGRDRNAARRRAFRTLDSPESSLTAVNAWLSGE
jgi:hypothetical protein